jgi:aspartate/methionine/tyrosine aminotransferase
LIAEAVPVPVPYDERHGYSVNKEALEGSITDRTKMIWMSNPCNPTGHVFSRSDLMNIAEVARNHDLIVFSDEIYEKLVYDGAEHISIGSLSGMEERTITVNGFSKAYAMTGWRIGYIAAKRELSAVLRRLHYYAALCPNAISQKGAVAALTGPQDCVEKMLEEYGERRRLMLDGLNRNESARYSVPNGAFYVFPDFSSFEESDDDLSMLLLRQAGVVSVPGSGFGKAGQGHIRLSYSISRELIKEGMERINRFMESH